MGSYSKNVNPSKLNIAFSKDLISSSHFTVSYDKKTVITKKTENGKLTLPIN